MFVLPQVGNSIFTTQPSQRNPDTLTMPRHALLSAAALPLLAAVAVLAPLPAAAEISGVVTSTSGQAVEQARVELVGRDRVAFSDARGRFSFPDVDPPAELRVSHPRYRDAGLVLAAADAAGAVTVSLEAKQEIYEAISVTATRASRQDGTPPTLAASSIDPLTLPADPVALTDVVRTVPGVAENGQGGLFQVFSIRGVSRQRVLTLVSGMQVTGERRAGVSTSFLDPRLMGEVDVVRGPASTWYGSGALGGVVEIFPRRFDTLSLETGWASSGDETYVSAGWGDETWSVGLAHRRAGDAENPDGERIFSRFERTAASLEGRWGGDQRTWELTVLPSLTTGIGKPNASYPQTITEYPREEHLMVKLSTVAADGSRVYAWIHPSTLQTRDTESDGGALVDNESLDLGVDLQREVALGERVSARLGGEYFGRRGVDAEEHGYDAAGREISRARTLDGAELDEAAAYGSLSWAARGATLSAGGRYTWQQQSNGGAGASDDDAWSGFLGAAVPLPAGFQVTANVGTGLRFPSLSERFFTGTTGRGQVVGSENLKPERSLNTDLGLAWYGDHLFLRGHLFRNEISDYIDRIRLPNGARTFVNLIEGSIEGVELEGNLQVASGWLVTASAHRIDGEDDGGQPLADVPPDRLRLGFTAEPAAGLAGGRLGFTVQGEWRDVVDEPGSGELPIDSAFLLEAAASYQMSDALRLTLRGTNLTDELYFPTADDLAVPAAGRSVGLSLGWSR